MPVGPFLQAEPMANPWQPIPISPGRGECPPRPNAEADDDTAKRQWLRRGRWLVENRQAVTSQADQIYAVAAYYRLKRNIVAQAGECSFAGCQPDNRTRTTAGAVVCIHTRRPCPAYQLKPILERWTMTTEITKPEPGQLVPAAQARQLMAIEQLRTATGSELADAEAQGHDVIKGLILAKAMQRLRELLTPEVMQDVMALQNSPLGFMTDRNQAGKPPYDVETVRDCAITALLQGFKLTGNEFNIISGRFYAAQAGCQARVQAWPGLHDLQIELGVPQMASEKGALVACSIRWQVGEKAYAIECKAPAGPDELDTRLAIRVNAGMGTDAILGKAKRKLYARAIERLTGISQDDRGDLPAMQNPAPPPKIEDTSHLADLVHEVLDALAADLETCEGVTDCDRRARAATVAIEGLAARGLPLPASEAAQRVIIDKRGQRAAAIRDGRGEGSNDA